MAKTPKSRYSDPKKTDATIDMDPKDVKRVDDAPAKQASGVADITAPGSLAEGAKDAEAKSVSETKADVAAAKPERNSTEAAKPIDPKPVGTKPADTKPADVKPAAPVADAVTPSAFATSSSASASDARNGSALTGGLIGGLVVLLVGGGVLWLSGALDGRADLEALRGQIAELQSRVEAQQPDLSGVEGEIEALRAEMGSVDAGALEERLAALETAIAEVSNAPEAEASLQAVEEQLASTGEAAGTNADRIAELDQRIAALEERGGGERVFAASALKAAIDRGQPFTTELDALSGLDPEAREVAALRDYAAEGVPTRGDITAEADDAARAMIEASRPAGEEASFVERLYSSAQSLVVVRPVGAPEGDDAASGIARLEAAIRGEDYAAAIEEYEALPPQVQEAGADFMAKVRARHAADGLIDDALTQALQES